MMICKVRKYVIKYSERLKNKNGNFLKKSWENACLFRKIFATLETTPSLYERHISLQFFVYRERERERERDCLHAQRERDSMKTTNMDRHLDTRLHSV